MDLRTLLFSLFILCNMIIQCYTRKPETEPSCHSSFDFQEKLLEKLVRLEHQLALLQEQTHQKEENTKAEVNSHESLLSKDNEKGAFHAEWIDTSTVAVGSPVIFTKVQVNDGAHYNAKDGMFKSAVNGVYLFSVNICIFYQKWFQVQIIKNGSIVIASTAISGESVGGVCSSASGIAQLEPCDYVWVKTTYYDTNGSYQDDRRIPSFSGVLLYSK